MLQAIKALREDLPGHPKGEDWCAAAGARTGWLDYVGNLGEAGLRPDYPCQGRAHAREEPISPPSPGPRQQFIVGVNVSLASKAIRL